MNGTFASPSPLGDEQMEALIQRALRFAREDCPDGSCPIDSELIRCVEDSVAIASRGTSIDTYIPVLAMKRVRECIVAGSCDLEDGRV